MKRTNLARFMRWLDQAGYSFTSYGQLWEWSVTEVEEFWKSIWDYFEVGQTQLDSILERRVMPGAQWFPGARVNYAEQIFRRAQHDKPILYFENESGQHDAYTYETLRRRVSGLVQVFRHWGVRPGDRVAAYLPNIPETVVAFLATASIGAIWSVCSPDFGAKSVLDRFRQIEPTVLLVVDGYIYNGKVYDRKPVSEMLMRELSSVQHVISVPYLEPSTSWDPPHPNVLRWHDIPFGSDVLIFDILPFQHPLWILYSSGTSGLPKPIVHGHGGMVLTHLVNGVLHHDLTDSDRFFWFTTTGWMMWNVVISALLAGSSIVLFDGSPSYPDLNRLWNMAERMSITTFGTSAAYIHSVMKAGIRPGNTHDLSALKVVATTGSPLSREAFYWVYDAIKRDVQLAPASGGTDVCSAFVGGCPILPVRVGEMQCRILGAKVEAFNERGQAVLNEVGELVVTEPMPAMPLFFWGDDADMSRYRQSYFSRFEKVWTHGDWIRITPSGGAIISGRSDSTINRYGVRMGSADIYGAVDTVPEVEDSLVVEFERSSGESFMPLFVRLRPGVSWSDELELRIRDAIRDHLSPRHLPDRTVCVSDIPKTLNGKKMEVPIKRLLMGQSLSQVLNPDTMMNPECLEEYRQFAESLSAPYTTSS